MPKGEDIFKAITRADYARTKYIDPLLAPFLEGGTYAPGSEAITQLASQGMARVPDPTTALSPLFSAFLAQLSSRQAQSSRTAADRLGALGIGGAQIENAFGGPLAAAQEGLLGLQGNAAGQYYQALTDQASAQNQRLASLRQQALGQTFQANQSQLEAQLGPILSGFYGSAGNRGGFGGFIQKAGPIIGQLAGAAFGGGFNPMSIFGGGGIGNAASAAGQGVRGYQALNTLRGSL